MGCEDFVVRLSSRSTAEDAVQTLLASPGVRFDESTPKLPGESHLCYEDPAHIIEIEVATAGIHSVVSIRFALCHPSTIDGVFAVFVSDVAGSLDAHVVVAEDVEPDDSELGWSFSPAQLGNLRRSLMQCIPKKRKLWQAEFGLTQARVSCREAIQRFVMGGSTEQS
jgi:hypothetical protein